MKKFVSIITTAAILGLLGGAGALAQQTASPQGQGMHGMDMMHAQPVYDPRTVETVSGEVVAVERTTPKGRMMKSRMSGTRYGVHLVLKTGKETIPVHLGPAWYIENQAVKIAPKDRIEVKGSRITFEGQPVLVAAQVTKGSEVLTLRDANGSPVWVGWRRR